MHWYGGSAFGTALSDDTEATIAAAIADDFAASATALEPSEAAIAADVAGDFAVGAALVEEVPAAISSELTTDFAAAASLTHSVLVSTTIATTMAGDFSVVALLQSGGLFVPFDSATDPRIAVITASPRVAVVTH